MAITNQSVVPDGFLREMSEDEYFPDYLVDKGKAILVELCERIERDYPADLAALYALTAVAIEQFNVLQSEFEAAGSEFETVAREEICEDIWIIATAYGFPEADSEMLAAGRDW